jgi:hypothetical protein
MVYFIFLGFLIGAINLLVLFPMFFSKNDQGLVRAMIDIGATLSVFCTLGTLPVVYKFYPFLYLMKTIIKMVLL